MTFIQCIKEFLKRFLPPPVKAFNREIERILAALSGQEKRLTSGLKALEEGQKEHLGSVMQEKNAYLERVIFEQGKQRDGYVEQHITHLCMRLEQQEKSISSVMETHQNEQVELIRHQQQMITVLFNRLNQVEQDHMEVLQKLDQLWSGTEKVQGTLLESAQKLTQTYDGVVENGEALQAVRERVSEAHKVVEAVREGVSENQKAVEAVREGVSEAHKAVEAAREGVSENQKAVEAVREGVSENRKAVEVIYEGVTETVKTVENIRVEITEIQKRIVEIHKELTEGRKDIADTQHELSQSGKKLNDVLVQGQNAQDKIIQNVECVRRHAVDASRNASEAVWAETFNNTISNSTWLKNTAFSPGRWAVGYPHLYVMYRVLNESRPGRILELGLGQSTRMIAQYAAANEDVEHIVVEHDPAWIAFFKNDFQLSARSKIVQLDREMVPYKEAEAVRVFKDFQKTFQNQKFDFISIDAPLGGDMKQYSRIDVLSILPDCLSDDFVVMIDDCDRPGEARTAIEIENCLKDAQVGYRRGKYSGKRDFVLFAAEHKGFLTTM